MNKSHHKKADIIFVIVLICFSFFLFYLPTGFEKNLIQTEKAKARIISVDNSIIENTTIIKLGSQRLETEIIQGRYKGNKIEIFNQLTGKMDFDEIYNEGQEIMVEFSIDEKGNIISGLARGTYRLENIFLLFLLFSGLLFVAAGWTGFKALLSFVFTALLLWKVMVPLFLKGYDPVWIAMAIITCLVLTISFLIGGFTRLGIVTALGAITGLLLTCILAQIFIQPFRIHGAVLPFSENLLFSGFNVNLSKIFIASIFIASAGAVLDLAMDLAAAMNEIKEKKPNISMMELIKSGFSVGRAVLGTMTTTLLFAYSGGYITMLMFFMGSGIPWQNIVNLHLISAEILNTLVGSFGLVTVAPFTAIAGGIIYSWKNV